MKITWSNAGWIVSMGLLIAILLCLLLDNCHGKPEIGVQSDSVQYWKNKNGELIASIKQKEDAFNVVSAGFLDSIAALHHTKAMDIKEAISIALKGKATIKGEGKTTIVYQPVEVWRDTGQPCPPHIKSLSEIFLSPYYTVQATIEANGDSSFVEIHTYDTINIVTKQVKEGNLFNRRNYLQVDVRNANPHNVVEGLKVYRVPSPKPKKFGIGLQVGYGWSKEGKPAPYIGIGGQWSIVRF